MREIEKSYNKSKKKYRLNRKSTYSDKWSIQFDKKEILEEIIKHDFKVGNSEFKLKPYKPYFLWSLWWIFLKIFKIKKAIATLTKNPVVSLIIGTLIVYAIMKFILHWI